MSYRDRVLRIMERFINSCDFYLFKLRFFLERVYNNETFSYEKIFLVRYLKDNYFLLEFFYGLIVFFKDVVLQLMFQMFVDVLWYNEFKIDSSRWVYFVMGLYCYFELFYILSSFYYLENVIYC